MAASHTPGPWYYSESHGVDFALNGEFIIQGSNSLGGGPILPILGRTHNFPKNAEANARLISAAPELLAAVKSALAFIEADTPLCEPGTCIGEITTLDLRTGKPQKFDLSALRSVIAKAEGRDA